MNSKFKKLFKVLLASVVVSIFLSSLSSFTLFGFPKIKEYFSRKSFNSAEWKNEELAVDGVRQKMIDNLLSDYNLIGKTKNEIVSLLGETKKTGYFKDYDFVYWLGPERGFMSIDSEWLVIKLNNNVVAEAKIIID